MRNLLSLDEATKLKNSFFLRFEWLKKSRIYFQMQQAFANILPLHLPPEISSQLSSGFNAKTMEFVMHEIVKFYRCKYYQENGLINWDTWIEDQGKRIDSQQSFFQVDNLSQEDILSTLDKLAEPSYQEVATSAFISDYFLSLGYQLNENTGKASFETEVIVGNPKTAVATIRCDLDALSFGNQVFKHACGHAINMTGVLEVAISIVDSTMKDNVAFIFQPAEEGPGNESEGYRHPKGFGGGQYLRSKGIYSGVDTIISSHIDTSLSEDEVRITSGLATAAAYRFSFDIDGIPSHAALPWQGKNPVDDVFDTLARCRDVNRKFKSLAESNLNLYGLITPTQIHTTSCELNSLSPKASIEGISRIVGKDVLDVFLDFIKHGSGSYEIESPPVINDSGLVNLAKRIAKEHNQKINGTPARFRDETAWAGDFEPPWANASDYPPGCNNVLHFFVSGGSGCYPLHSNDFESNLKPVKWQSTITKNIIREICS